MTSILSRMAAAGSLVFSGDRAQVCLLRLLSMLSLSLMNRMKRVLYHAGAHRTGQVLLSGPPVTSSCVLPQLMGL